MKHQSEPANKANRKFQQSGMEKVQVVYLVCNNITDFFVSIVNELKD